MSPVKGLFYAFVYRYMFILIQITCNADMKYVNRTYIDNSLYEDKILG